MGKSLPVKGELVKEPITFELTQKEIAEKGKKASEHASKAAFLQAQLKDVQSDLKSQIIIEQQALSALLKCVKLGKEDRVVECTKHLNKSEDTVEFYYEGIMMKERPATEVDKQKAIPFLRKKESAIEISEANATNEG